MKKKKQSNINESIIKIERADALTYVKIKHPLRKSTEVYVSNVELNLLTFYSITCKSKDSQEYKDFLMLMMMIDARNCLTPIKYR